MSRHGFDTTRFKNIDGSPLIQIVDKKTGKVIEMREQEYIAMFSSTKAELESLLDQIIARNRTISKMEMVSALADVVDELIREIIDDKTLLRWKRIA